MPERSPATTTTSTTKPQENARASSYPRSDSDNEVPGPAVPAPAPTYLSRNGSRTLRPYLNWKSTASAHCSESTRSRQPHAIGPTLVPSVSEIDGWRKSSGRRETDGKRRRYTVRPSPHSRLQLNANFSECVVPSNNVTVTVRHVPAHAASVFHVRTYSIPFQITPAKPVVLLGTLTRGAVSHVVACVVTGFDGTTLVPRFAPSENGS